jgi:hypothetical protein
VSLQQTSDRILKELQLHLAEKVRPPRRLRELGWYDFRAIDHPEETDAIVMAHAAFLYLSLDSEANWNEASDVLIAVLAYLRAATGNAATESNLQQLSALLREKPVSRQRLQDWLDKVYRF